MASVSKDLTTSTRLAAYLSNQFPQSTFTSIEPLPGGTANYLYLVHTSIPRNPAMIIKHAAPFIKTNPSIPFPVSRISFEASALRHLPDHLERSADSPSLPGLIHFDPDASLLTTVAAGPLNLKEAYVQLSSLDVPAIGRRLGRWLAILHKAARVVAIEDNVIGKAMYRYSYRNLGSALESYGVENGAQLGEQVDTEFGAMLETDDEVLCHGDFWPGNVLIGNGPEERHNFGSETEARTQRMESTQSCAEDSVPLTIIDWEMVRRGCGATDVGQFAAEAWLLDHFCGGKGLLEAFLNGYIKGIGESKVEEEWRRRAAIHFGTHLGFWPTRVEWARRKETEEVVRFGAEILVRAKHKDWKWLKEMALGELWASHSSL